MFKSTQKRIKVLLIATFLLFLAVIVFAFFVRNNNIAQYDKAKEYMNREDYDKAIDVLRNLKYEDSEILIIYLEAKILFDNKDYEGAISKLMDIEDFQDSKEQIQLAKYKLAIQYFENKDYDAAKQLFKDLNNYEDSKIYLERIDREQLVQLTENTYDLACNLLENKEYKMALENFSLILGYEDSEEKVEICKRYMLAHVISGGILNSFGITKDEKVLVAGDNSYNQGNVALWENIVSIDGYGEYTIGLTKYGTVNVAGNLSEAQKEIISTWENIIDVAAGDLYVVVLKSDGTVASVGHNGDGQCDVEDWENVVDIDAGWRFTVGLTQDGELLFTGRIPNKMKEDYLNTKDKWKDVVAIVASGGDPTHDDRGSGHVVGLTSDGHVIAIGDNSKGQCDVNGEDWEHIVAIAAGDWYTVALTEEGKVLINGENVSGSKYIEQEKIDTWEHIQDIAAGYGQTLVVKSDGHVDAMGFDDWGKYSEAIAWIEEITQYRSHTAPSYAPWAEGSYEWDYGE